MFTMLEVVGELGGVGAMTPASWGMFSLRLTPFVPPRPPEEDRAVLLDALGRLAEVGERAGARLLLEPLNRYEDHMVNRLDQAAALVRTVGSPALGVVTSTLGHVQLSDSNRLEPGPGHLDWTALLATLAAVGYAGTLAFECRLSGPAETVLPRAVRLLRGAAS